MLSLRANRDETRRHNADRSMNEFNRYWRADLSQPPLGVACFITPLLGQHISFTQSEERWLVVMYHHYGSLGIGSRAFLYEPGCLAVIPPGARVTHDRSGEGALVNWMDFVLPGTAGPDVSLPLLTKLEYPDFVQKDIDHASVMVGRTGKMISSVIWATLWRIHKPASFYREFEELYAAEQFIRDNLHQVIRVGDVAWRAGVSTRTLLRMFRLSHGCSVEEYITTLRTETARRLLANTDQSIKQIAAKVGIGSYQHFNNLIRNSTGMSPTDYREHARKAH